MNFSSKNNTGNRFPAQKNLQKHFTENLKKNTLVFSENFPKFWAKIKYDRTARNSKNEIFFLMLVPPSTLAPPKFDPRCATAVKNGLRVPNLFRCRTFGRPGHLVDWTVGQLDSWPTGQGALGLGLMPESTNYPVGQVSSIQFIHRTNLYKKCLYYNILKFKYKKILKKSQTVKIKYFRAK